jgi:hypothetical protein
MIVGIFNLLVELDETWAFIEQEEVDKKLEFAIELASADMRL